jgi:hypothetical protein
MATLSNIISFARAQAQTDSNGLTDANAIIFANEALFDFHRRLVRHGVDASQLQETYIPTVTAPAAGIGSTFAYPTDCLALKTVAVNYQDTTPSNYRIADQIDVSNVPNQVSFQWLRVNQSAEFPKFDDRGDWYEIFPAFKTGNNLTNAIWLFYYLKPTEYTSTADTISYPESQDIRILGWRIVSNYWKSLEKWDSVPAAEAEYDKRIEDYIATLGRGSQQPLTAATIQDSGWQY